MKLTDEIVAKALGYQEHKRFYTSAKRGPDQSMWKSPEGEILGNFSKLPNWTGSLDAIVAEIEARGLFIVIQSHGNWDGGPKWTAGLRKEMSHGYSSYTRHTPAEALCAALLAYLSTPRPKGEKERT